jgi:PhnB protein
MTEASNEQAHDDRVTPGQPVLIPYICVREAASAIDWYVDVFGATETTRRFVEPDGTIGHAALEIGGADLMLSDAHPDYGAVAPEPGNTTATYALNIYVPDADSTVAAAERAGAVVQRRVEEQFYGSRMGVIVDPFGVRWMVATHVRDVSQEEIDRAAAEYSGAEPGPVG